MYVEDSLIIPSNLMKINLLFEWIFHFVKRTRINLKILSKNSTISQMENILLQYIRLKTKQKFYFYQKARTFI